MSDLEIVIGNKNYSSWSLRGWLALKATGEPFTEIRLPLDTARFHEEIGRYSPTREVPVLRDGDRVVWDSLAIAEYLADTFPAAMLLPEDRGVRALARCVSAEMHSGFETLRARLPMNVRAEGREVATDEPRLAADIARIRAIWRQCREVGVVDGPWLLGHFTIADAMYAPVASRFHTYGVECGDIEHAYIDTVMTSSHLQEWSAAAREESEVLEHDEVG